MLLNAKMVMGRLVIAGVAGAAMLVSAPLVSAQEAEFTAIQRLPPTTFVPGEVIVRLRPGTSEQSRDQVLAMVDGVFIRSLDLSDLIVARVPVGTEVSSAESLNVDPNVVFAEPNGRMQVSAQ